MLANFDHFYIRKEPLLYIQNSEKHSKNGEQKLTHLTEKRKRSHLQGVAVEITFKSFEEYCGYPHGSYDHTRSPNFVNIFEILQTLFPLLELFGFLAFEINFI